MGPKICPSTPCMVNNGTNAATVIVAEKKIALSTCSALAKINLRRSVHVLGVRVGIGRGIGAEGTLGEVFQ
jgi:hypothetical protein